MKAFYENRTYNAPTSIFVEEMENLDFVAHWHSDIEIIYVCKGSIGAGINNEYKILSEGEILICGSNDIHYYNSENMISKVIMIIFKHDIFDTSKYWEDNIIPHSIFLNKNFYDDNNAHDDIQTYFKDVFLMIKKEICLQQELYRQFIKLRISELFLLIFRFFPSYYKNCLGQADSLLLTSIKPMQKALKYLEDNYKQDITLDIISKEVNLSSFYFSRLFKKTAGTNFSTYLTLIRISRAEDLIKTTKKHIIDIAYETGFHSIRTFNRAFMNLKGYTPQSLRKKYLT